MIKSMTGFGRNEFTKNKFKFSVEIKTVNHRYCDISIKLPKKISFLEPQVRKKVATYINRGKVDVYISYEDLGEESNSVEINDGLIKDYLTNFDKLKENFGLVDDITLSFIVRLPDVLKLEDKQLDENILWETLNEALTNSLEKVIEMRKREGELLFEDFNKKLDHLKSITKKIKDRSPMVVKEYQNKLEIRIAELVKQNEVDDGRITTEVAIFADRCSIDEEIVRLESHINQMKYSLKSKDPIGRKLDFLAQEMNREANTIASKSNDLEITNNAIELKADIEKIREQIQNVE